MIGHAALGRRAGVPCTGTTVATLLSLCRLLGRSVCVCPRYDTLKAPGNGADEASSQRSAASGAPPRKVLLGDSQGVQPCYTRTVQSQDVDRGRPIMGWGGKAGALGPYRDGPAAGTCFHPVHWHRITQLERRALRLRPLGRNAARTAIATAEARTVSTHVPESVPVRHALTTSGRSQPIVVPASRTGPNEGLSLTASRRRVDRKQGGQADG